MAVVATLSKGYDLDYIWKNVDRGPGRDAASYYIQASETRGEPPGRWWGPGARALGFESGQRIEREPYDLLFGERQAPDGTPLGRHPDNGRKAADVYKLLLAAKPHATAERKRELRTEAVRKARQSPLFFDLTVSLSKSISIFHASLGENARLARQAGDRDGDAHWSALVGEVDDMIWRAVHAGFSYFQREAGYTRTGSHGTRVHGRETSQWREADLAVAHWLQHTSRDGDMQLHVHSHHLALLHAIWAAETTPARDQAYRARLMNTLPPGYRRQPGHQAKWLWRTLRAAELAGLNPASVLADAIAERDLAGSHDIAAVLDARIRHRLGTLVPLPPSPWSERVPALADPNARRTSPRSQP